MEDKYNELLAEGKSDNEAVGIVIAEFGNLDEVAEELGIRGVMDGERGSSGMGRAASRHVTAEEAEQFLSKLGFYQSRVRMHGMLARIELQKEELYKMAGEKLGMQISEKLKEIAFTYVTLDLEGYRMGSMNETLSIQKGKENNE